MANTITIIDRIGNWFLSIFPKDTWGVLGNWFNGFAALTVVFLALGLQAWYEHRRRPKLKVIYRKDDDNDNRYVKLNDKQLPIASSDKEEQSVEELWLRVNVFNNSKATAENVELRFIYCTKEGSSIKEDRPSWWFKVSNLNAIAISVPPHFMQPFDIAYIKNFEKIDKDLSFYIAIVPPDLNQWPQEKERIESELSNNLEIGIQYRLVFAVVASNSDAKYYEIKIKVSERDVQDITKKHLQGRDVLRRRFQISGPSLIESP